MPTPLGGTLTCDSTLANACGSTWGNPLGYTGRPLSAVTGLYDMRSRHYDPHLRQWTAPDPLGYIDGFDVWGYVGGDPLNYIDPFGTSGHKPPGSEESASNRPNTPGYVSPGNSGKPSIGTSSGPGRPTGQSPGGGIAGDPLKDAKTRLKNRMSALGGQGEGVRPGASALTRDEQNELRERIDAAGSEEELEPLQELICGMLVPGGDHFGKAGCKATGAGGAGAAGGGQPPGKYGPFHRKKSPTQTKDDAALQQSSGEVWGAPRRDSNIPQVQAYDGPLPAGKKGIEFYTDVPPDSGTVPNMPRWTGPRDGVVVEDEGKRDYAKIRVVITRVEY